MSALNFSENYGILDGGDLRADFSVKLNFYVRSVEVCRPRNATLCLRLDVGVTVSAG